MAQNLACLLANPRTAHHRVETSWGIWIFFRAVLLFYKRKLNRGNYKYSNSCFWKWNFVINRDSTRRTFSEIGFDGLGLPLRFRMIPTYQMLLVVALPVPQQYAAQEGENQLG